jgi:hypothetical protein
MVEASPSSAGRIVFHGCSGKTWFIEKGEYGTLKTILTWGLWITLGRSYQAFSEAEPGR